MFKGKTISPLLVLFSVLISYSESRAVPAPPHPICVINATVLDIQKTKTQIGGRGPNYSYVDHYAVKLKIYNSSVVRQSEFGVSCDKLINSEQDSILHLSEYDKSPIKTGQEINANIEFRGDEWFHGYFLSDIKILDKQ